MPQTTLEQEKDAEDTSSRAYWTTVQVSHSGVDVRAIPCKQFLMGARFCGMRCCRASHTDLLLPPASLHCTPCISHHPQQDGDICLAGDHAPQIGTDTLFALPCVLSSFDFKMVGSIPRTILVSPCSVKERLECKS